MSRCPAQRFNRASIGYSAMTVTTPPNVRLRVMTGKAFKRTEPTAIFSVQRRRFVSQHSMICAGLEKLPDPQPARISCSLFGRQCVVGTDDLVAEADVCARAKEQGPEIGRAHV